MEEIAYELATRIAVLEGRAGGSTKPDTGPLISGTWIAETSQMISVYFSDDDFLDLCLRLNIDHESLGGNGKRARASSLVSYMDRRGRSSELIELLDRLREHVAWPTV